MRNISKILIANRGEIACRIIRSAKKLGIKTVAVYSSIDKNAINVSMSDEAYCIGQSSSLDSYLRQDKIINVAKTAGCEAVHPGYGFLSENADFAKSCEDNNLVFIGPPSSAIRDMGIKSTSKKIMAKANVPVISGYHGSDQSDEVLMMEAERIGFPLMIKAVRGGGGKGMKIAVNKDEFLPQLESARRESLGAFGDQVVLLERYVTSPRHVEVQIFGDRYGNYVYLFERDCSVQRRHQKIIEEAPAPKLNRKTREDLGCSAVRAAKAVNYIGAGTVEFIYDQNDGLFYFMEMNTRLQVEHIVTEMITGTDLVEWQLRVADGEELPLKQKDISLNGHAVEARIYAEDPYNEFLPTAGQVKYLSTPETSNHVRIETSIQEGDDISVHYDPMIAKVIVWAQNRQEAFSKMSSLLLNYNIAGPSTNIDFLKDLCKHREIVTGNVDTNFISTYKGELLQIKNPTSEILIQACLALILWEEYEAIRHSTNAGQFLNPWVLERGFRINHYFTRSLTLKCNNTEYKIDVTYKDDKCFDISVKDENDKCNIKTADILFTNKKYPDLLIIHDDFSVCKCKFFFENNQEFYLFTKNGTYNFKSVGIYFENDYNEQQDIEHLHNATVSPMPGVINKILVNCGDKVKIGDHLVVVMAMKMEYIVKSPVNGIVEEILFNVGESVSKNAHLIKISED